MSNEYSLPLASPASVGFSTERLDRLDDAMQVEIDAGHYAGISVMVARHDKLVKSRRYGYQSLGGSEPLREDAIYRIASMTKPIIAVAMLLLYEEGRWQLDDPVTKPKVGVPIRRGTSPRKSPCLNSCSANSVCFP